jgi:homocitrate synthase NifV
MEKKLKIIDRTVPEIVKKNNKASKSELLQFCRVLKNLGADFIEVDRTSVNILQELMGDMKFIYRIREKEDASLISQHRFFGILVDKIENLKELAAYKLEIKTSQRIILEIHLDSIEELNQWLAEAGDIKFNKIYSIRISGVSRSLLWSNGLDFSELSETYGVKFDLCPEDEYYCASAMALEALERGADFVTTAFCGEGGREGFAALEEVIMALKVLYNFNMGIEPSFF